ncbi:alanine racemase [Salmonella enterica subsp. enterica serovar Weltevreden]|nr:alanine racemase [Salmonella enterica subsp. enterica serovar Weltevreden]
MARLEELYVCERAGSRPILLLEGFRRRRSADHFAQCLHTAVHNPEQLAATEAGGAGGAGNGLDETGYRYMHRLGVRPEEGGGVLPASTHCKSSASR